MSESIAIKSIHTQYLLQGFTITNQRRGLIARAIPLLPKQDADSLILCKQFQLYLEYQ